MISKISLLTALLFSAVYPLCFWIHSKDPLKNNFHRFHVGLPAFVGGVAVAAIFFANCPSQLKTIALAWEILFLLICGYYWKKETVDPRIITIPCLLGIWVLCLVQSLILLKPVSLTTMVPLVLGGIIFCSAIYAMNLGHWYLNIHGLPLGHLMRAVNVFWFFLGLRLLWDIFAILTTQVVSGGQGLLLWQFMQHLDGFFLWIAVFFGTLMPIGTLYFVRGTLLVKSTQSATGILYVILIAVLIGDITYKYYLIRYGVAL